MTQERQYTWEDAVAIIGQEFGGDEVHVADEAIEYTAVARYCEPWEITNPIHWDKAVTKQAGYRDVVAPWSGLRQTWVYFNQRGELVARIDTGMYSYNPGEQQPQK